MDDEQIQKKKDGLAKRLANLVPYQIKKGQVLNPKGRGKGKDYWNWASKLSAPEALVEPMRLKFKLHKGKVSVEQAVILRLALEACRGDMKAIEIWIDRKYGKATQPLDVTTPAGPLVAILNAPEGAQHVCVTSPHNNRTELNNADSKEIQSTP